uniref:CPW-WPC domain-containing protein n=1 Tax=Theileria parva TaxID=5875 RepID=Q4N1D0_THEPA|eukprot:XP_764453.1 hypothetical protein [Theileria parva strain Muguga]
MKLIIFLYINLLYNFIYTSGTRITPGDEESNDKSVASSLSSDLGDLSENVNEVTEEYSEDSGETGTPKEIKEKKIRKNYQKEFDKDFLDAEKVVEKQYNKYVKGTYESLDLIQFSSEHLKRFWYTGQCKRNYTLECPKSWVKVENGCKAPENYSGDCDDLRDFSNMKPEEKEDFAWRCQVEWPCINEMPIDEGFECPFEWAPISDSLCLAPKTYDGICSPIIDMSTVDISKKAFYEWKCNVYSS